jgi:zinc/manganese transport system substrate-binding protein
MKSLHTLLLTAFATLASSSIAHADVTVVATVPDLAALAKQVGGDKVDVTAMSLSSQDPHFVDAKPSLTLRLNKAELLLAVGLELEVGWLPTLQTNARNKRILAGSRGYLECWMFISPKDFQVRADRSQGDIHRGGNPHYLYAPANAVKCANAIANKLGELDPDNAKTYDANAKAFAKQVDKAIVGWEKRLAPYKGTAIVTYHRSFVYLTDWLGLESVIALEPKPGIPPSPRHVARVLKTAKAKKAALVLQESYYPDKTGKLVAKKIGGRVVSIHGGCDFHSGEKYIEHMEEVVTQLEEALSGKEPK